MLASLTSVCNDSSARNRAVLTPNDVSRKVCRNANAVFLERVDLNLRPVVFFRGGIDPVDVASQIRRYRDLESFEARNSCQDSFACFADGCNGRGLSCAQSL